MANNSTINEFSLGIFFNASSMAAHNAELFRERQLLIFFVAVILTNGTGILSNILLLIATAVHQPLRRSSSSPLIVHCLLIDLYTAAISTPIGFIPIYLGPVGHDYLAQSICKYNTLILYLPIGCSMWASSVLAVHRFIAAIFPHQFVCLTRKPALFCLIVLPWTVASIVNVLPVFQIGKMYVRSPATGACVLLSSANDNTQLILSTVSGYYFPTAVMGVCYTIVLVKTLIDAKRRANSQAIKRRLEISRTLFVSFTWHCLTTYPTLIVLTFYPRQYGGSLTLQLALKYFGSSYSAGNPIFFLASSKMFQAGAREVLRCRWFRLSAVGDDVTTREVGTKRNGKSFTADRHGHPDIDPRRKRPMFLQDKRSSGKYLTTNY
ncbi:hypothetical protein BV898_16834 [Hypsibius exemplaris]|uniref:G-protein coupled receptors family 1 profile domain-containing protein n=1 Tax=Hypsibius exemplaris TaxID=2072580 RepID=A0A9X6NFN1_HYPEX|nr:hypothetical protein BV898_16834 [Hypsibius exemplaris]